MSRIHLTLADRVWLALGVILVATLIAPPDTTGDGLGLRRTLTPEISTEWNVAQRFRMNARHLNAIEIRAAAIGPVSGTFRLTLRDRDARNVERSADVPAATLVRDSSYVFRFAPIQDSEGHEYQLEVTPTPDDPGRGVALRATKGGRPEGRALRINNAPRWASLAFRTSTPEVSFARTLLSDAEPGGLPGWLGLIGLVGGWMTLRFILHAVAVPADSRAADARISTGALL